MPLCIKLVHLIQEQTMHILEQDRDKQVQAKSHKNGISPNSSTTNLHKTANSFHYPLIFLQKTPQKDTNRHGYAKSA